MAEARAHLRIGIAQQHIRFVGVAVQGVLISQRLQAVCRCGIAALRVIERPAAHLAFGNHFLNFTKPLLSRRREFAVRKLNQQIAAFVLGAKGVVHIAVRLLHLPEMNHAHFLLCFGRFFQRGIEQNEVFILGFGLRQSVRAAFAEPAIGIRQLRFRQVLTGVVGVHQRLQRKPRHFIAAPLHVVDRFVEQHFVGLLGILRNGVLILLALESAGTD